MIHSIFKKETFQYLTTATGYISLAVFFVATWLFCWVIPSTSILEYGFAEMGTFFEIAPYIFLFLIPALTMRLLSEEYKTGTFELLITKPVSVIKIILGKYFSSIFLILIALGMTLIYFVSIYYLANPIGNVDVSGIIGSYVGLWLLGSVFGSIGIFTSSITDNQVVAFILSFVFCYILYDGISRIAEIQSFSGNVSYFLQNLGLAAHYQSMGRGVVDSRDLIYFLGIIVFFLFLTKISIDFRRN
ncbi:MAG: ABC transporter permease subunit [Bacteroidota bacterium]